MNPYLPYRPYRPYLAGAVAGEAPVVPLFLDDLSDLAIAAAGTPTRASTAYHQQPDGTWVPALSAESRMSGARRAYNRWSVSNNITQHIAVTGAGVVTNNGITVTGDVIEFVNDSSYYYVNANAGFATGDTVTFRIRIESGTANGVFGLRVTQGNALPFSPNKIVPIATADLPKTISFTATITDGNPSVQVGFETRAGFPTGVTTNLRGTISVPHIQVERVTGATNQNPSEAITSGIATGPELVVNGGFDSDTGFVKGTGWTITGGVAVGTATTNNLEQQTWTPQAGHTYRIEYDLTVTGGTVRPIIGGINSLITDSTSGHKVHLITATNSTGYLYIDAIAAFTGTIDNLTCKECAHNAGVNGVKYFTTANGNTVDANGVVTEAVGAALPGPFGLLMEPVQTNLLLKNSDLTTTPWLEYLITRSTTTLLGLPAATLTGINVTSTDFAIYWDAAAIITSGTVHTAWCYAQAGTADGVCLSVGRTGHQSNDCGFDLTNGTVVAYGTFITAAAIYAMGNGIYLCAVQFTADNTQFRWRTYMGPAANIITASGLTKGSFSSFAGLNKTIKCGVPHVYAGTIDLVMQSPILTTGSSVVRAVDALSYSGIPASNATRLVINGANVDIDNWNDAIPVPTVPKVLQRVTVYNPGERPA